MAERKGSPSSLFLDSILSCPSHATTSCQVITISHLGHCSHLPLGPPGSSLAHLPPVHSPTAARMTFLKHHAGCAFPLLKIRESP